MTVKAKKAVRLQEWILTEAFANGQAWQGDICAAGKNGRDNTDRYFITRYAVYQRFFRLPVDSLFQGPGNRDALRRYARVRLRSTTILCESVRRLVNAGLIRFPIRAFAKKGGDDPAQAFSTLICLTEAGIRLAESLISRTRDPESPDAPAETWDGAAI